MDTMYLNTSILLLTCLIFATSAPPKKDGLETEYKNAKWRFNIPNERGFNEVEMAKYAGINVSELIEIANSISIENLENINLETFKLLVKEIKRMRGHTTRGAQKERGLGPSKLSPSDKGLEKEYSVAKKKLFVPDRRGFNEIEMAYYAGINVSELREIANSISIENLENINLKTFKLLVKAIKTKRTTAIRELQKELPVDRCDTPSLEKGLEKEYGVAKRRLDVPDERGFNEVEMAHYAGMNVSELREIANSIFIDNLKNINMDTFKLLVKAITIRRKSNTREFRVEQEPGPSFRPISNSPGARLNDAPGQNANWRLFHTTK